jgi:hypothetical protein
MVSRLARLQHRRELMEAPDLDAAALGRTLQDLAWINRRLGGLRLILGQLERLLPHLPRPVRILDVGTGYADIPRGIVDWARRRRVPVAVEAVDRHPGVLALAQAASQAYPEIRVRAAEATALPYASGSVHLALASLLLHHLEGEEPVRLLRELDRVASRAALVNDLRRGWLPLAATWLGLRLCSRDPLIRHDGPLSVRRAFSPAEMLALAREAGWRAPRVTQHVPFRLALVTRKGRDGAP